MPKKTEWVYEVTGRGDFPIDMLRYDRAFPATEEDSYKIKYTFGTPSKNEPTIKLKSNLRGPTTARWASFGWYAVEL